jgi:molecular chaperone DnaK
MAKDAEAHAAEDKEQRDKVEARNGLDSMVYNVEKMLKDSGDKVADADKAEVETALADAKTTLTGDPGATELNAAKERLTSASHKLAEAMYKAAAAAAPAEGAPAEAAPDASKEAKKDEGVIDAEYVDVEK